MVELACVKLWVLSVAWGKKISNKSLIVDICSFKKKNDSEKAL